MPEEGSLIGTFVFAVSFIGIFVILVVTMPSQFYTTAPEYQQYSYPSFFNKEDIEYIAFMRNETINLGDIYYSVILDFTDPPEIAKGERGTINFKFTVEWYDNGWAISKQRINFQHIEWEWFTFRRRHPMYCFNEPDKTPSLSKANIVANWDEEYNASIIYPVSCNCIVTKVWFVDPNTTRNNISEAFDEGSLIVVMGFGFDDYQTSISAWSLVGQLLFFQAPQIHPVLNAIIALPIWATISVLIYLLILKAIPFVGD